MTPSKIKEKVITEKIQWIAGMVDNIKALPLETYEEFIADKRNIASAESYLRRGLEALMDIGRHILSKAFSKAVIEYKDVAKKLNEQNVIGKKSTDKMMQLAGYRNRMVHFYHEIKEKELYDICKYEIDDITQLLNAIIKWINNNPDKIDRSL